MSKYRCPRCGAAHKEPVASCRLCGQGMTGETEMPYTAPIDQTASFDKYRRQSVIPYILGGLALVVVLGIAAVAFGVADSNELGDAAQEVPVLGDNDGQWQDYEDPDGRFVAVLPVEDPSVSQVELLGTQATITETAIADQMELGIIWLENPQLDGESTLAQLRPVAEQFAELSNAEIDTEVVVGSFQGYPAVVASASGFNYNGSPGNLAMRIVQVDDDVVILATTSVERGPDQHGRLIDGFEITVSTDDTAETDDTTG